VGIKMTSVVEKIRTLYKLMGSNIILEIDNEYYGAIYISSDLGDKSFYYDNKEDCIADFNEFAKLIEQKKSLFASIEIR
jgi:hypothetical protein